MGLLFKALSIKLLQVYLLIAAISSLMSWKRLTVLKGIFMFEGYANSHGLEGSSSCPIAWMDDLYELSMEADKVLSFI